MVKIGTPLTPVAKKALLCGSGELGKEVAIELQRYGVEVIALDRYENAPAMQIAHRSYVLSMLDGPRLREIIEKEKPDMIIPEVEAIAKTIYEDFLLQAKTVTVQEARSKALFSMQLFASSVRVSWNSDWDSIINTSSLENLDNAMLTVKDLIEVEFINNAFVTQTTVRESIVTNGRRLC